MAVLNDLASLLPILLFCAWKWVDDALLKHTCYLSNNISTQAPCSSPVKVWLMDVLWSHVKPQKHCAKDSKSILCCTNWTSFLVEDFLDVQLILKPLLVADLIHINQMASCYPHM